MAARRVALAVVFGLLALEGAVSFGLRYALDAYGQALPLLHLVTGVAGLAFSLRERPQRLYGAAFGAGYLALALAGALGRFGPAWLPLEGQDHAVHAVAGLAAAALSLWKPRAAKKSGARGRSKRR